MAAYHLKGRKKPAASNIGTKYGKMKGFSQFCKKK
jgi:hypothetical protein